MARLRDGSPVPLESAALDTVTRSGDKGAQLLRVFLPAALGALSVSEVPPVGMACLGLAAVQCVGPFRQRSRAVLAAFVLSAIPSWYLAGMTLLAMAFETGTDAEILVYRLISAGFFLVPFVVAQGARVVVRRTRRRRGH
jgi:hypothetical protein